MMESTILKPTELPKHETQVKSSALELKNSSLDVIKLAAVLTFLVLSAVSFVVQLPKNSQEVHVSVRSAELSFKTVIGAKSCNFPTNGCKFLHSVVSLVRSLTFISK